MTKAQYIPGPWKVNSMTRIEAPDFGLIASVRGDLNRSRTHANARLLAAAPELLLALQKVLDDGHDDFGYGREAIVKATGGQP